jgi:diguanylate cyclase (GGDEF)-like protein
MSTFNSLQSALARLQTGQASPEELEILRSFVQRATQALEEAQVRDRFHLSTQDIINSLDIAVSISACVDANQVARVIASHLADLLDAEACIISRWEESDNALSLWVEHKPDEWALSSGWYRPDDLNAYHLARMALEHLRPVQARLDDAGLDGAEREFMRSVGIKSLLVLPLVTQNHRIGLIEVMDRRFSRQFSQREITLGMLLANNAAVAIEKTWLFQEVRQRSAELEAIHKASLSLTASLDLNEVLYTILENTLTLLSDAQDAHIFLYDGDRLSFGAALWADGRKDQPWSHPRPEGLTYTVARRGEMILVPDMQEHPLFKGVPPSWTGSIVGLPLKIGDRVVGVMTVAHPEPGIFSDSNLRVLRLLGDQAAIAIENARLHNLVAHQARTDVLTDLPNRRALDEKLEEEIQRASRYHHPLAVMMIDLDDFKVVNDTLGHPMGDQVLKRVAVCLKQSVREIDFVARYGGDEFVLLLPETDLSTAQELARRLGQVMLACPMDLLEDVSIQIGLSFGIAVFPSQGVTASALLAAADQALYHSKVEDEI